MFPYRMFVEWSHEDEAYIARVPALNVAADGPTPQEAVTEAQVVSELALEALNGEGRRIPESDIASGYSGQIRLRLPRSLHRDLALLSSAEGVSLNQVMLEQLAERRASFTGVLDMVLELKDEVAKIRHEREATQSDDSPAPPVHANP